MKGSLRVFHTLRALQFLHEAAHSLVYCEYNGLSGSNTEDTGGDPLVECPVTFLAPHIERNRRYPLKCALIRGSW